MGRITNEDLKLKRQGVRTLMFFSHITCVYYTGWLGEDPKPDCCKKAC